MYVKGVQTIYLVSGSQSILIVGDEIQASQKELKKENN